MRQVYLLDLYSRYSERTHQKSQNTFSRRSLGKAVGGDHPDGKPHLRIYYEQSLSFFGRLRLTVLSGRYNKLWSKE